MGSLGVRGWVSGAQWVGQGGAVGLSSIIGAQWGSAARSAGLSGQKFGSAGVCRYFSNTRFRVEVQQTLSFFTCCFIIKISFLN